MKLRNRSLTATVAPFTISAALLLIGAMPSWAQTYGDLGAAQGYNVFVFGNVSQENTDAQGKIAVGGNATYTNYDAGQNLNSFSDGTALKVGGNLTATNGSIRGSGAQVGGAATLNGTGLPNSGASVVQNYNFGTFFSGAQTYLTNASTTWGNLSTNGTIALNGNGGLQLTGTSSTLNVFNLTQAQFEAGQRIDVSVPTGATALVNVAGTSVQVKNVGTAGLLGGTTYDNILFNFPTATQIRVDGSLYGGILAPRADLQATYGQIDGTVIAASLDKDAANTSQPAHVQINTSVNGSNATFNGRFLPKATTTPVPDAPAGSLLLMGLPMVGGLLARRRTA